MDNRDIKIRAYRFSVSIVKFINTIIISSINNSLKIQLWRSATSVGANIIEAKSAHSKKDFIKFYEISLKSANETKYWLCLLRDGLSIDKNQIEILLKEIGEISNIIAAIIIKLKNADNKLIKEELQPYNSDPFDL